MVEFSNVPPISPLFGASGTPSSETPFTGIFNTMDLYLQGSTLDSKSAKRLESLCKTLSFFSPNNQRFQSDLENIRALCKEGTTTSSLQSLMADLRRDAPTSLTIPDIKQGLEKSLTKLQDDFNIMPPDREMINDESYSIDKIAYSLGTVSPDIYRKLETDLEDFRGKS